MYVVPLVKLVAGALTKANDSENDTGNLYVTKRCKTLGLNTFLTGFTSDEKIWTAKTLQHTL